jgi:anti-sigma regulatory factor (Ser/Thr protein kinase)
MSEPPWGRRAMPQPVPDARIIGRWRPVRAADVTASRRQLAAAVRDGDRPAAASDGAVERLLLAFEELVSNGMRHGRAPVRAAVTAFDGCWLLEVSDADVHRPPAPAVGRDPASGGLGLHLVARICSAHGWQPDGTRKTVWAVVEHAPATAALPGDPAGHQPP